MKVSGQLILAKVWQAPFFLFLFFPSFFFFLNSDWSLLFITPELPLLPFLKSTLFTTILPRPLGGDFHVL